MYLQIMIFKCKRCGYETKEQRNLTRHFNRIIKCDPIFEDVNIEKMIEELNEQTRKKPCFCIYCSKRFVNRSNTVKHMKQCKSKDTITIDKKDFLDLKNLFEELKHKIGNNSGTNNGLICNGNGNNNNVTVNIAPRNFGDENMEAIPIDLIRSTFINLNFDMLFENLHCDPDFPENHNVRIKSTKRELLEIYNNNKWNTRNFEDGYKQIIFQIYYIFNNFAKKNTDMITEDMDDDELCENMERLTKIKNWVDETHKKFRMIKEAKQVNDVLESNR